MDWKVLNDILTDTWSIDDDGTTGRYLHTNKEAKEIMTELRVNGMVHRDDDIPYLTWDNFDNMSETRAEWLYKKALRLVEIKRG